MAPSSMLAGSGLLLAALGACADSGPQGEPDWMASIDDARRLTELSIPGTHDSGARFEPHPGLAKTQELTIAEQLTAGVRYFDVRCRHFEDGFLIYHGAIDQNQSFDEVLATMFAFLDAHPMETLIVSIKEEAAPYGATRSFEATFAAYVSLAPDRWYLAPALPSVGDVRGKLVLLRRFTATATPLGLDASPWSDNTTFSISNADAPMRVQDAYMVLDNESKWLAITDLFAEAATADASTLFLDYTSGYQTISGLPNITNVMSDINLRLDLFLAEAVLTHAHLGVVVTDFATAARVGAIVSLNAP